MIASSKKTLSLLETGEGWLYPAFTLDACTPSLPVTAAHGVTRGMSRTANPYDHALAESRARGTAAVKRSTPRHQRSTLRCAFAMVTTFPPVSWQRMSEAVEKVRRRLLRAAAALAEARVPYAVVGGNAVAAWVSRADEAAVRNTRDVDLLLARADLPAATAALEAAGFHHRRVASLGQAGAMDVFLDGAEGKVGDAVHIVFAGEKTRPDQPEPNARIDESEDTGEFRLISLEALVRMKLAAFRDKDRVHLRDLVSVGLVDPTWLPRFSTELRLRLEQILASPEG